MSDSLDNVYGEAKDFKKIRRMLPLDDPSAIVRCECHRNESLVSLEAALAKPRATLDLLANNDRSLLASLVREVEVCLEQCKHRTSKDDSSSLTMEHADEFNILGRARFRISPIGSCPPEIMHEIFSHLTLGSDVSLRSQKVDGSMFHLTWICQSWRKLILGRGRYWSRVDIDLSLVPDDARFVDFIVDCISRSKNAPVHLRLREAEPSDSHEEIIVLTQKQCHVFESLVLASSRWEEVYLELGPGMAGHCSSSSFQLLVSRTPLIAMPLLKFLSLHSEAHGDPLPASLLRQFGHCPLLKIFHAVFYHHLHLATGQIDLNHLTELAIGHYVGKGLAELLAECPALEYLAIAGFQYSEVSVEGISKTLKAEISHAQLSTLHIGFIKEDFDDRAMEGVSLPGLQSLTLRAIPSIGDFLHPNQTRHGEFIVTLQAMLRRSNCNLQSLSLIRVQEEAAIALISGCPSISHLSCTETDISETLLAQLTLTEDSRVAPNLITLGMGSATVANSFLENCKAFEESCCRLVESRVYSTRLESAVIGDASQGLRRFLLRPLRPRDHPNLRDSTERIQSRLQSLGLKEVVVSVDFKWFNETMLDD